MTRDGMKRISVLAVLVLLVALAAPAMAATTFSWSGEVTSVFQTNFITAKEAVTTANVSVGVTINDVLSFSGLVLTSAVPGYGLTNGNGAFYATIQLGKILGLDPKTIVEAVSVGNFGPGATTYGVSGVGKEGVFGAGMTAGNVSLQSVTTIKSMVNVLLAVDPASLWAASPSYLVDIYGTLGPVSASLGYGSNKIQGADVKFAQTLGDIGFAVDVQEQYNIGASTYQIGFGGKFTYTSLLTFGIGTNYGSAGFGDLGVNLNLAPAATWGADMYTVMHLTATPFDASGGYVDASVWTKLDASTLRIGYVYTNGAVAGNYVAQTAGGLYLLYDLAF